VTLLGTTGSIGASSLDVIARHPGRFHAVALTAQSKVDPWSSCACASGLSLL